MTAKEKLLMWIFSTSPEWVLRTSDVDKWGILNHSTRAMRDARDLRGKGLLERVEDKRRYGIFDSREDCYILTEAGREKARELLKKRDFPLLK